jgi:tRNA-uridine 2-sulfurtransferase
MPYRLKNRSVVELRDMVAARARLAIVPAMSALDLPGTPSETRVVVAMSGGVDSSVVAALLKAAGYDVVGITLQLYDHGAAVRAKGACCAGQDIHDARRVAERLAIPHYVLDYESRFREAVIDDFADSYARGETPVPCVRCNQTVKFCDLLGTARDLGAAALATGHYARRLPRPNGDELHRARDRRRDQSYFLFATTAAQLAFIRFPLGHLTKDETRRLASEFDLPVAEKPDSQDICFVPNGRYAQTIERLRPGASEPGEIVDLQGRVVGQHDGIIHYTVGQRRGLVAGGAEPLYVIRLEPDRRRVVIGPRAALGIGHIRVRQLNWLGPPATPQPFDGTVQIRSTGQTLPARIQLGESGVAVVDLCAPELGVSPGQACVIYAGERLLGGGWIDAAEAAVTAASAA